jgi:protein involved in polysaccharide export with SLBB domain
MSKNVYVLGDVNKPGKYPMKGDNITLREAIIAADLPTRTAALRRCYIVTPDAKNPTLEKVDMFELLYKGRESLNCNLFPNQIVVVPSTIPSEINRALTMILSPASQYDNLDTIYDRQVNNKDTTFR